MSSSLNLMEQKESANADCLQRLVRRLGKFKVSGFLLRDWEKLLPIMGNMVVVRCEFRYDIDCAEYTAFSPLFDEVPDGCEPPQYEIIRSIGDFGEKFDARKVA
jgi:hypothetical protein